MRKRDTFRLIGGTVTGMSIVLNVMAFTAIREKFYRHTPKAAKPGKIDSVDEMHIDYLRRKSLDWIASQEVEELTVRSQDGLTLTGKYIHNSEAKRSGSDPVKLVILSHNYMGTGYKDLLIFGDFYRKQGYDIMVIDQRAHGDSEGEIICFGAKEKEDMIRWVRLAIDKAGAGSHILLHGWSMGAAIAYLAAAQGLPPQVKGIVYDCGYSTAEAEIFYTAKKITHLPKVILWYVLQMMKPWCKLVCGFDMDDTAPLFVSRDMKLPILFVHGDADTSVPLWMGRRLYEATDKTPYRDMLIVKGAEHTCSYARDKKAYEAAVIKLMNNCME